MHLGSTGQAVHTAIAAATQHCEHAAIIRTVVYNGFRLIYVGFFKIQHNCKTDDNANATLPRKNKNIPAIIFM